MFRTRVLAALAAAAAVAVPQAPSQAVSSLAYTFVVNCASGDPVTSLVDLPEGNYAVAITGACTMIGSSGGVIEADSCKVLAPYPCVDPVRVWNVPSEACQVSHGYGYARTCYPTETRWCPNYGGFVVVDGQCSFGKLINHARTGPMNARFVDSNYADNIGAFTVTVTWTPA